MEPERFTAITHESAKRRFHHGAFYLMGMAAWSDKELDPKDVMGVVSVMAYLGAYAYPDANLYYLRQAMIDRSGVPKAENGRGVACEPRNGNG